jgi:uncharacterized protein (DUF697 family)
MAQFLQQYFSKTRKTMTSPDSNDSSSNPFQAATADALKTAQAFVDKLHQMVEQGTETMGAVVTPIAENPLIKFATKVPGVSWLMAALGQVNVEKVQQEVAQLRLDHPLETDDQLAQRVVVEAAWRAAGIGLATNFIPPLALALFAVDLGAIAALQAEMVYRIAAIYGFSPEEPTRRGEVLAIWGLSMGGSGVLKTGLSLVELLPGIGAAVGITSDAALLSGLGYLACRFYQNKKAAAG